MLCQKHYVLKQATRDNGIGSHCQWHLAQPTATTINLKLKRTRKHVTYQQTRPAWQNDKIQSACYVNKYFRKIKQKQTNNDFHSCETPSPCRNKRF